jgi:hypothetical protein
MWSLGEKSGHLEKKSVILEEKIGLDTSEVLLQGQQQHKHDQPMQKSRSKPSIPETVQMWQKTIRNDLMQSILESKGF